MLGPCLKTVTAVEYKSRSDPTAGAGGTVGVTTSHAASAQEIERLQKAADRIGSQRRQAEAQLQALCAEQRGLRQEAARAASAVAAAAASVRGMRAAARVGSDRDVHSLQAGVQRLGQKLEAATAALESARSDVRQVGGAGFGVHEAIYTIQRDGAVQLAGFRHGCGWSVAPVSLPAEHQ